MTYEKAKHFNSRSFTEIRGKEMSLLIQPMADIEVVEVDPKNCQ